MVLSESVDTSLGPLASGTREEKKGRNGGLLADKVLDYIRGLIASGQLNPGDRVNELETEKKALLEILDAHDAEMVAKPSSTYPSGSSDWDFHRAIFVGARNEIALRIGGSDLRDLLSLLRARHGHRPGRGRRALQEHCWVADAIAAGNADLASSLMAQHIRASRNNLIKWLREASQ
jgi:DNA-binding GntR family transcriptional regulator